MDSNTVNTVITSPPYNMNLRVRNGKYCSRQIVKELTTKYENFKDNLPMDDYFEFNRSVIEECLRVSKQVFYNVQFLTGNKRALFKLMGHFNEKLKEVIIWDKVNAQPAIGENILNSQYEVILCLDNEDSITRAFKTAKFKRGTLSNVWKIKRGKKEFKNHGAQFPLELVETIVKNFTNENDIILDPFMGTGTTGVVCKMLGRKFTGIELDENYYRISKERIIDTPIPLFNLKQ